MLPPESDISVSSLLLAIGAFTLALLNLGALTCFYLYWAQTAGARRAAYALLLLSGCLVFLTFLYVLAPRTLIAFPVICGVLFLGCLVTYFTSRFCPSCGRPTPRYRLFLQFTHCPYCGSGYEDGASDPDGEP